MPLPLGHKIPRILPSPTCLRLLLDPHALERVSNGFLWLEIGADSLSAQALGMVLEQRQNALAHGAAWSASAALRAIGYRRFCV